MTNARAFEATTYLKVAQRQEITKLARNLDTKAREHASQYSDLSVIEVRPTPSISSVAISLEVIGNTPSTAAERAKSFLNAVLEAMHTEGESFEAQSRELAYA